MSLSFKICSNSLANSPQCLSPIPIFLGLSYYFGRIFHSFGIFFVKIELNLDLNSQISTVIGFPSLQK